MFSFTNCGIIFCSIKYSYDYKMQYDDRCSWFLITIKVLCVLLFLTDSPIGEPLLTFLVMFLGIILPLFYVTFN